MLISLSMRLEELVISVIIQILIIIRTSIDARRSRSSSQAEQRTYRKGDEKSKIEYKYTLDFSHS